MTTADPVQAFVKDAEKVKTLHAYADREEMGPCLEDLSPDCAYCRERMWRALLADREATLTAVRALAEGWATDYPEHDSRDKAEYSRAYAMELRRVLAVPTTTTHETTHG